MHFLLGKIKYVKIIERMFERVRPRLQKVKEVLNNGLIFEEVKLGVLKLKNCANSKENHIKSSFFVKGGGLECECVEVVLFAIKMNKY